MSYQPYRNFVCAAAHSCPMIRDKVTHFVHTAGKIRDLTTDKVIKYFVGQARRSGKYLVDKDTYTKRLWLVIIVMVIMVFPNPYHPGSNLNPNISYYLFQHAQGMALLIIIIICCFYIVIEDT